MNTHVNESDDFISVVYDESSRLFNVDEVELLAARTPEGDLLPDVRITHIPTGITEDVSAYQSQMKNAVIARLRLFQRVRKAGDESEV